MLRILADPSLCLACWKFWTVEGPPTRLLVGLPEMGLYLLIMVLALVVFWELELTMELPTMLILWWLIRVELAVECLFMK